MNKPRRAVFRSPLSQPNKTKRQIFFILCFLFVSASATFAQDGVAGITQASTLLKSYFTHIQTLIFAIAALVGLVGGIKCYGKFSSGDPDAAKTASAWFGACVFLIVCGSVLKSFFGA